MMTDDSQHTHHCPNCEQTARERDEAVAEAESLRMYVDKLLDQQDIIAQDRARRVKERDEAVAEVARLEAVREKALLAIEYMTQAVEQAEEKLEREHDAFMKLTAWGERAWPVVETVKAWRDHSDYRADSVADELARAYDIYDAGNAHTSAGERSHTTNK